MNLRQITPYCVWIGHAGDGTAFRELFDLGIRAVVQIAAEEPPIQTPRELVYLRVPLFDGTGNDPVLLEFAIRSVESFIRKEIPTLVCCGAGMSRSPAIVAAALMSLRSEEIEKCLEFVIKSSPVDLSAGLFADVKSIMDAG